MSMLLVLIVDYVAMFRTYQYLTNKLNLMKKYAYPLHLAFAVFLVICHLVYYMKTHEANYFELFGIDRLFTQEDLDRVHELKLSRLRDEVGIVPQTTEKINKINHIYGILNHVILCQLYDKYKKDDGRVEDLLFNSINIQTIVQSLMEYLISFIVLSLCTKEENLKGCRKWIAAVMVMFFSNEINMQLSIRDHRDWFFDGYFSRLAIFDRIMLIRYCMIPCLLTIRLNYVLFNKTTFLKMSDQIRMTFEQQREIGKNCLKNTNNPEVRNTLKNIEDNIQKSLDRIEGGHQNIKEFEVKKKSGCWKCLKICLYIFIVLVFLQYLSDQNFEVIYKVGDNGDNED